MENVIPQQDTRTKITLIEDINKLSKLYRNRVLNVEEFDTYYDATIEELEAVIQSLHFMELCQSLYSQFKFD
jgi:hypothetical protein